MKKPLIPLFFFFVGTSVFAQQDMGNEERDHTAGAPPVSVPISLEVDEKATKNNFVSPKGYSVQTGSQLGLQLKTHTISMVSGEYKPKPGIDKDLLTSIAVGEINYALIQIRGEEFVSEELFSRIKSLGVEIFGELPGLAWQAKIPANAVHDLVNIPEVRWVGHLPKKLKLSPSILSIKNDEIIKATISIMGDDWEDGQESVAFSVTANAGVDTPEEAVVFSTYLTNGQFQKTLEGIGLEPIVYHRNSRSFKVSGEAAVIKDLARLPIVSFIDHAPEPQLDHAETTPMAGHDYIRATFDGAGAHLGIIDSEVMMADGNKHDDLTPYYVAWDNTGQGFGSNPSGHGTHVAGTIIGRGNADTRHEGMGPGAGNSATSRFFHGRFFNSTGSGIGDPNTLYSAMASDFTDSSGNVSTRPHAVNHSWGSPTSTDTAGTSQSAIDNDTYVWGGQAFIRSAGNGGTSTMGRQSTAKNSLSVGNAKSHEVDNTTGGTPGDNTAGDLHITSSRGITSDGRFGVEITAPGAYNVSTDGNNMPSGYIVNLGTSMATPHVTGIVGTLLQHYPVLEDNPALIRAWLKATALKKGGSNAPDGNFGFGYVNSYRAHYSNSDWDLDYWATPDVKSGVLGNWDSFTLSTDASDTRLVVIINWDEPPVTTTGGATSILADVELRIDWNDDQAGGDTGDVASTGADNQQFIIVDNPPAGTHKIKVWPVDTRLNGLFAEDLTYSLVVLKEKADVRPDLTLSSSFVDDTIKSSDIAMLESTLTVSDYVGTNAMFNVLDNGGLTAVSKETTLEDGKVVHYDGATDPSWPTVNVTGWSSQFSLERLMLGAIVHTRGGSRSISVGFTAPGEGTYSLETKGNIDNGPHGYGDSDYEYPTLIVDDTAPSEVSNLTSSTHPVNVWTNSASADFSWDAATDALAGVDGYGLFTTSLPSRPGNIKDIEEVTSHSETLSEGTRYFNISTVDNSGNWSSSYESYGPVKVDLTQPGVVGSLTSSSHSVGVPSSNPTVDWSWSAASDNLSGIDGYGIYTASSAGSPSYTKDIEEVTSYSETLPEGTWYFNIRSVDNAGNWDSDYESYGPIIIDLPPVYSITPMTAGSPCTLTVENCDPNSSVLLGYSFSGAGPTSTAFGFVDMSAPINVLTRMTANNSGTASKTVNVPPGFSGRTLYTQGVNNGVLTNSLAAPIL